MTITSNACQRKITCFAGFMPQTEVSGQMLAQSESLNLLDTRQLAPRACSRMQWQKGWRGMANAPA